MADNDVRVLELAALESPRDPSAQLVCAATLDRNGQSRKALTFYKRAERIYLDSLSNLGYSGEAIEFLNKRRLEYIRLRPFGYNEISVPYSLRIRREVVADLGTGRPDDELAPKSLTRAEYMALYMVGRNLELKIGEPSKLPKEVQKAGTVVYKFAQARNQEGERISRGGWHKDAVLIEPADIRTIPGKGRKPEHSIAARYFRNIRGFNQDQTNIIEGPYTQEAQLWLPPSGWGVGEIDENGLWTETIPGEKKEDAAQKVAANLGITPEQANSEMSYQWRPEYGRIFGVRSKSHKRYGPVGLLFSYLPRAWSTIGSFPASRFPLDK